MIPIHVMLLQEWITTKIIIIVMTQPMKTATITKITEELMNMEPALTQLMKMVPSIPEILQKITNKILWIIILQTSHQEWDPLKKQ